MTTAFPRAARRRAAAAALVLAGVGATAAAAPAAPFLGTLTTTSPVASTVPASGDLNPYGVAVVPRTVGALHRGDVLVSNFNAKSNLQGTGTTIVQVSPAGAHTVFATVTAAGVAGRCPGGVGLTTALVVVRRGFVIVGSLPTRTGTAATARAGCLIVLNARGRVVRTIRGRGLAGPWDMAAVDHGLRATLFVSTVLNGTVAAHGAVVNRGAVARLELSLAGRVPRVLGIRDVASGFAERSDPAALVIGPTGLALGRDGTLYVADTASNRVAGIPNAMTRTTTALTGVDVSAGGALDGPLGLATAPGGDILATNAGNGDAVEITPAGRQVAHATISTGGAGALFGLAIRPGGHGIYFVDDAANQLSLRH